MNFGWPETPIGDVAISVDRPENPLSGTLYRQVGVRLWGKGAYERESIDGAETKYKTLNRTEEGDIVVNKIWARNGSVSTIGENTAGCYVSGEFPLFVPIPDRLEPTWFRWITKTKWFWHRCDEKSRGTSGKNRIRPERFLSIKIPLPPLSEQRRIVARIERLAGKVEEARGLRKDANCIANAYHNSVICHAFRKLESQTKRLIKIGDLTTCDRYGPRFYNEAYSIEGVGILRATDIDERGRIDYVSMPKMLVSPDEQDRFSLHVGDFVVVRSGSIGLCAVHYENVQCIPAAYLLHFRFKKGVHPNYVRYAFLSKISELKGKERGTALKNINADMVKNLNIPDIPPNEQRHIVEYLDGLQAKIDELKAQQTKTASALDAMLPSVLDRAFQGEL